MRFINAEGIHTEGSRPAARRSLVDRRHIQPHAMIHADVLCDSSGLFRTTSDQNLRTARKFRHT